MQLVSLAAQSNCWLHRGIVLVAASHRYILRGHIFDGSCVAVSAEKISTHRCRKTNRERRERGSPFKTARSIRGAAGQSFNERQRASKARPIRVFLAVNDPKSKSCGLVLLTIKDVVGESLRMKVEEHVSSRLSSPTSGGTPRLTSIGASSPRRVGFQQRTQQI